MQYVHIKWIHSFLDEPIDIYAEIDDNRWEIRKIEVFKSDRVGCACLSQSSALTKLGIEPIPTIEEISNDPQFVAKEISKKDFEEVWSLLCIPLLSLS
jgi:hypothetical protein